MKRIILYTFVFLLLFGCSISWEKSNDRSYDNVQLSNSLKQKISNDTKGYSDDQIIEYSINLTADELRFSKINDISNHKANCVGYAQLCSSICNCAFILNHSDSRAKPVVGYIKIFGFNIHPLAQKLLPSLKNFVANHDYVQCGTTFFDPSIYDVSFGLLGSKC